MNAEKPQVLWLGTRQQLAKVHIVIAEIQLMSASILISSTVSELFSIVH